MCLYPHFSMPQRRKADSPIGGPFRGKVRTNFMLSSQMPHAAHTSDVRTGLYSTPLIETVYFSDPENLTLSPRRLAWVCDSAKLFELPQATAGKVVSTAVSPQDELALSASLQWAPCRADTWESVTRWCLGGERVPRSARGPGDTPISPPRLALLPAADAGVRGTRAAVPLSWPPACAPGSAPWWQ